MEIMISGFHRHCSVAPNLTSHGNRFIRLHIIPHQVKICTNLLNKRKDHAIIIYYNTGNCKYFCKYTEKG